jgi:two-component system response regulator
VVNNKINILLVEDNPGDIRLAQEAFRYIAEVEQLYTVRDGEEAVKFLYKYPPFETATTPCLILLDLNLPKKSGKEILKMIKEDSDLKVIPVLILSTSKSSSDIIYCYENHANSYLTKPVDFEIFLNLVKQITSFWIKTCTLPILQQQQY